jgi:hypothetical protein
VTNSLTTSVARVRLIDRRLPLVLSFSGNLVARRFGTFATLSLSKQTLATLARASRSRQLRKAPVEAHEVLAGQVVDPTERIELLEIAQGYFQLADHIAATALRATEPDSIPDGQCFPQQSVGASGTERGSPRCLSASREGVTT